MLGHMGHVGSRLPGRAFADAPTVTVPIMQATADRISEHSFKKKSLQNEP
jgi:hypothetical protein